MRSAWQDFSKRARETWTEMAEKGSSLFSGRAVDDDVESKEDEIETEKKQTVSSLIPIDKVLPRKISDQPWDIFEVYYGHDLSHYNPHVQHSKSALVCIIFNEGKWFFLDIFSQNGTRQEKIIGLSKELPTEIQGIPVEYIEDQEGQLTPLEREVSEKIKEKVTSEMERSRDRPMIPEIELHRLIQYITRVCPMYHPFESSGIISQKNQIEYREEKIELKALRHRVLSLTAINISEELERGKKSFLDRSQKELNSSSEDALNENSSLIEEGKGIETEIRGKLEEKKGKKKIVVLEPYISDIEKEQDRDIRRTLEERKKKLCEELKQELTLRFDYLKENQQLLQNLIQSSPTCFSQFNSKENNSFFTQFDGDIEDFFKRYRDFGKENFPFDEDFIEKQNSSSAEHPLEDVEDVEEKFNKYMEAHKKESSRTVEKWVSLIQATDVLIGESKQRQREIAEKLQYLERQKKDLAKTKEDMEKDKKEISQDITEIEKEIDDCIEKVKTNITQKEDENERNRKEVNKRIVDIKASIEGSKGKIRQSIIQLEETMSEKMSDEQKKEIEEDQAGDNIEQDVGECFNVTDTNIIQASLDKNRQDVKAISEKVTQKKDNLEVIKREITKEFIQSDFVDDCFGKYKANCGRHIGGVLYETLEDFREACEREATRPRQNIDIEYKNRRPELLRRVNWISKIIFLLGVIFSSGGEKRKLPGNSKRRFIELQPLFLDGGFKRRDVFWEEISVWKTRYPWIFGIWPFIKLTTCLDKRERRKQIVETFNSISRGEKTFQWMHDQRVGSSHSERIGQLKENYEKEERDLKKLKEEKSQLLEFQQSMEQEKRELLEFQKSIESNRNNFSVLDLPQVFKEELRKISRDISILQENEKERLTLMSKLRTNSQVEKEKSAKDRGLLILPEMSIIIQKMAMVEQKKSDYVKKFVGYVSDDFWTREKKEELERVLEREKQEQEDFIIRIQKKLEEKSLVVISLVSKQDSLLLVEIQREYSSLEDEFNSLNLELESLLKKAKEFHTFLVKASSQIETKYRLSPT